MSQIGRRSPRLSAHVEPLRSKVKSSYLLRYAPCYQMKLFVHVRVVLYKTFKRSCVSGRRSQLLAAVTAENTCTVIITGLSHQMSSFAQVGALSSSKIICSGRGIVIKLSYLPR